MSTAAISTIEPPAPSALLKSQSLAKLTTIKARALIEPMLKKGVTFERVLSEVYFELQKNPKLQSCTAESMIMAVAQCVKWDLTIGEKVYIVPFSVKVKTDKGDEWEDRAQAIRDYKGDIDLIIRAGAARYVAAHNVYEHEHFRYELGTTPLIEHKPIMDPAKRGRLVGSYAVAKISRDDVQIVVLSRDEIDQSRMQHSKQWKDHYVKGQKEKVPFTLEELPWYGPKTCVHRLAKFLPTSPKLEMVRREFEAEDTAEIDGPVVDIPALDAPQNDLRQLGAGAPAADADGVALATPDQKRRITDLLGAADIDDVRRVDYATEAGPSTFTSDAADAMIAELEKLVPPTTEEQGSLV